MINTHLVQLYPSRITVTPPRAKLEFHKVKFNSQSPNKYSAEKNNYKSNFEKKNNPFILSKSSKKKLMDSINSMYILSQPRNIKMQTGKNIFNYRMSFITLTLPAKQNHEDTTIKKIILNQFLVEIRKHYNVKNYIWKAELQENKNIHFHLLIDQYIDFQALRRRWNRCLEKLNYVSEYKKKFENLSLLNYHKLRNTNAEFPFEKSKKAYALGKKHKWENPNTVDVRSVYSKKELAIYLSKYITKPITKSKNAKNEEKRQITFGRSWARSTSLSSLKYQNKYLVSEVKNLLNYIISEKEKVKTIISDWYTVFYFSAETLNKKFQDFHKLFIINNAKLYKYPFPT